MPLASQIINSTSSAVQGPLYQFLKRRQDDQRFYKLIEVSATFGLITLFLLFAIRPAIVTISSLYTEIQTKQSLIKELRSKIDTIVTAQQNFAQVQSKYQILEDVLPENPEISDAGVQIRGLFQKQNLPLQTITFSVDQDLPSTLKLTEKNLGAIQSTLQVPINYSQIDSLLGQFKDIRRIIYFDKLSLSTKTNTKENTKNIITLSISPYIFYLPSQNNPKNAK